MAAVVQFRHRQCAERLIYSSKVSQKTEYPCQNAQKCSVDAEFVYVQEWCVSAYC